MNKRITSLMLCFVMVFAMLATAVPALAAGPFDLKVTADKTEASPGDTITFTITLGPVSDMGSMQMDLVIPEGLTYVANSGKLADGLKETLGFDAADWTDATINLEGKNRINGGASAADYSSDKDTVLATFQCTVNNDAAGTLEVGLDNLEFYSCQTWVDHTAEYRVIKASVTVTAAPKPATGIKLNKSTTTIYTGANETLIATVEPNDTTDTVTWTSSNTAVATVDTNGKVTAVATGTATITATAGSQSASCVVTVENAPCTHTNKTNVGAKSSTCKEKGWDTYFVCDDCGQLFDEEGNKISAIPYRSLADHTPAQTAAIEYLKDEATCTSPAVYYGAFAGSAAKRTWQGNDKLFLPILSRSFPIHISA